MWQGGSAGEKQLLASAYGNSLALARRQGVRSIAFPAISTGVYGYPPDEAAPIAVGTVLAALRGEAHFARIIFCCFSPQSRAHHAEALARLEDAIDLCRPGAERKG